MPTIQQIIDDTKARYRHTFPDTTVVMWMDSIHKRMWKMVPRDAVPVVIILDGTGMYAIPSGVHRRHIKKVTLGPQPSGPFVTLNYENLNEDQKSGYSITGNYITLIEPLPPTGATWKYMLFIYYDKVDPTSLIGLATTQKPELDEVFHEALTMGVLEMIAAARKDVRMKNNFANEHNVLMGDFMIEVIDNDPEYPSPRDDLPRKGRYYGRSTLEDGFDRIT